MQRLPLPFERTSTTELLTVAGCDGAVGQAGVDLCQLVLDFLRNDILEVVERGQARAAEDVAALERAVRHRQRAGPQHRG